MPTAPLRTPKPPPAAAGVQPPPPLRRARRKAAAADVDTVDARFLETLLGYNARRASLAVIGEFLPRMAVYQLRPVDFSVLSLITHNPGITSRQLCAALGILPPNLVGMLQALVQRGLVQRLPHPSDGRAIGLHLTEPGQTLMASAEVTAAELEAHAARHLTLPERRTLLRLLRKVYQSR